jgi:hypothetical protein
MKKSNIKKLQESGQTAAYSRDQDCAYAYEVKILDVDATRKVYSGRGFASASHTAPGIKIEFVSAGKGATRTEVVASSMIKMTWAEYQERHAARMNRVQERKERLEASRKAAEYQAGRIFAAYEKATGEPPRYGQVTIGSRTRLGEPTAYHVEVAPEVLDAIPGAGGA